MGVRIALGAVSGDIHRIVIGRSLALVGVGMAAGMVGALAMSRLISGLLYEVSPADPVTLVLPAVVLVLVATGASAVPARRATRLDPVAVLNSE
jgi:ABC-type antimicrobial peptide transport system permease subunit